MEKQICYKPIGIIYTPFITPENIPVQNIGANGIKATIKIFAEFVSGLKDLEGFSHIILLYHLHLVEHFSLTVKPFLDDIEHGVFSTRSPVRPNPIGLTVVKLNEIKGNILYIENVDMVDGTPLIDIKPFVPAIDNMEVIKIGWLTGKVEQFIHKKSDKRFSKEEKL